MHNYISKRIFSTPIAIFVILCTALYVWNLSEVNNRCLCIKDCGETFIAQHQVQNFRLYGFKHLLLEDHATSMDEERHAFLYTHNVNIGALTFQVLEYFGVSSFELKQVFTLLIFSLGLLYVYMAINYTTKSKIIAFIALLFSITDINQILSFATNALRAWHWLAIFGILYHTARYASENKRGYINTAAILFFATAAFGVGYEFFCICIILAIATILVLGKFEDESYKAKVKKIVFVLFIASIPFVARQIQVAYVMGFEYWAEDFYYSFVIKVPFIVRLFPLDFDAINSFYAQHNVLRPPASPAGHQTISQNFNLFMMLVNAVLIPEAGIISVLLFAIIASASVLFIIYYTCVRNIISYKRVIFSKPNLNVMSRMSKILHELHNASVMPALKLLLVLMFSFAIGLYLFLPFSLHVYFKHQFPLVAVLLHLGKAILVAYLIYLFTYKLKSKYANYILAIVVALIIADHLMVHVVTKDKKSQLATGWISDVKNEPNASYAVSWIPSTVAGYTESWVVGIKPGNERIIAERFLTSGKLFTPNDLFLFGTKNADVSYNFLKPDYWLYFRSDTLIPFDTIAGTQGKDYLVRHIKNLFTINNKIKVDKSWISQPKVAPGSTISFGGSLASISHQVKYLEILSPMLDLDPSLVGDLEKRIQATNDVINIKVNTNSFYGEYHIPSEYFGILKSLNLKKADLLIPIAAVFKDGTKKVLLNKILTIDTNEPITHNTQYGMQPGQLAVDDLIQMLNLPVKYIGDNYVIFDLKGV